jgi:hypothetical protein
MLHTEETVQSNVNIIDDSKKAKPLPMLRTVRSVIIPTVLRQVTCTPARTVKHAY